jgi:GNAT superfamily N-acetyltransferase
MIDRELYATRVRELNPSVVVRPASESDAQAFVDLFNASYKRKTTIEYCHWQFFDQTVPSALFVAADAGKIIGFFGVKIMPVFPGMRGGFTVDLLIHEDWRKRGIGWVLEPAVAEYCERHGASFMAALPNTFGNAAFKAMGWKSIAKIHTLIRQDGAPVSDASPKGVDENLIHFIKEASYLHWRFERHPLYRYANVEHSNGNFAVTKLFPDPGGKIFGDIVLVQADANVRYDLLKQVVHQLASEGVKEITLWALPHTAAYAQALSLGFVPAPQERYFCIRTLSADNDKVLGIRNWDLSECDSEIY